MGRRRGFFAELQHQQRLVEQRKRRQDAEAVRAYNQAVREEQRAQRDYERAQQQFARASAAEKREAEKLAKERHRQRMIAKAEKQTRHFADIYEQIDGILAATIEVDDYVDLAALREVPDVPPFDPGELAVPTPLPQWLQPVPEPVFTPPPAPSGLAKFGSQKKYQQMHAQAVLEWQQQHAHWQHYVAVTVPQTNEALRHQHEQAESDRLVRLDAARREHDARCQKEEARVAQHNRKIDEFIRSMENNDTAAIDEYVGIVLANSVYPEAFEVSHDYAFDGDLKELTLSVSVPPPDAIPSVKSVKYVATADELRATMLSQKAQRDRYNGAVNAVALRTLHEVFEADRSHHVDSIAMTVGTTLIDPATGHHATIPFVRVAATRDQVLGLNLARVEPGPALAGLGAAISKNAYGSIGVHGVG
ncbi:hypothetical protein [Gordonia sp. NPDC003429]